MKAIACVTLLRIVARPAEERFGQLSPARFLPAAVALRLAYGGHSDSVKVTRQADRLSSYLPAIPAQPNRSLTVLPDCRALHEFHLQGDLRSGCSPADLASNVLNRVGKTLDTCRTDTVVLASRNLYGLTAETACRSPPEDRSTGAANLVVKSWPCRSARVA